MTRFGIYFLNDGRKVQVEFNADVASGEFGTIVYGKNSVGNFEISCLTVVITKPSEFLWEISSNKIYFQYSCDGAIILKEQLNCLLARGQYNFYHTMHDQVYRFSHEGTYKIFILNFPVEYFLSHSKYYFFVARFLQKIDAGEPSFLSRLNGFGSHEIKQLTETVFKNPSKAAIDNLVITAIEQLKDVCNHKCISLSIDKTGEDFMFRPEEKYNIKSLAKEMYTNPGKLKKDFKKRFRMPVITFLRKMKMEHARQLLLETDLPISEIAFQLGYTNPAHFSSVFKKNMGSAPRDIRKKIA